MHATIGFVASGPLAASREVTGVAYTGEATIDSLLAGTRWASQELTYALPPDQAAWGAAFPIGLASAAFAPTESLTRALDLILAGESDLPGGQAQRLTSLAAFTNLQVSRTEDLETATLRFGAASELPGLFGLAGFPGVETFEVSEVTGLWGAGFRGGDTWLSAAMFVDGPGGLLDPVPGSVAWHVIMHELGHALGLSHPHSENDRFGGLLFQMPAARDSVEFTNMAYRMPVGGSTGDQQLRGSYDMPQTWMTHDIQALQHLYGANYATHAGNTTYRFDPETGEVFVDGIGQGAPGANIILLTIWDGGGIDTYDFAAYGTDLRIDLTPGAGSLLAVNQLADLTPANTGEARGTHLAQRNVYNALLYQDDPRSLIENAVGGSGNDHILGNQAANWLRGGAGADTLDGGAGADTLDGGEGIDLLRGGTGNDTYLVDHQLDRIWERPGEGIDTVIASTGYRLGLNLEVLRLTEAAGAAFGHGNDLSNHIVGNSFDNFLTGGAGNDNLNGLDGDDRLDGGAGDDLLYGGAGDDRLYGGDGNDLLSGGTGNDRMFGGAGDDVYRVEDAGDRVLEYANEGYDRVLASIDYRLTQHVERLDLVGFAVNGYGNAEANWIVGNTLDNLLAGHDGADTIMGGLGNDTLVGGRGDDVLIGGAGHDRLLGGDGADTLVGGSGNDTLLGGDGADYFAFDTDSTGHSLISDFNLAEDRLDASDLFLDVLSLMAALVDLGRHTRLDFAPTGGSVLLRNIAFADITEAIFVFEPPEAETSSLWLA
ncbi:M10 family metallopeptidase C-terminal domain-containing protein [Falsiroseomonas sp.]|uniref:M10 family metallopeptidase C-terminal domain-containing protein n=2 Tax=Falsiroseomonas sp. TaxID=2870721 RepID=UPI0027265DD0|nr:M10 family metallopeptidase C-terminal domain-containing protein [Falsiroseomonas sp.]MDO9500972.1 M10 family metallopeptidase C-terminal domain-containing protein [Falsiroseomonas sp.]